MSMSKYPTELHSLHNIRSDKLGGDQSKRCGMHRTVYILAVYMLLVWGEALERKRVLCVCLVCVFLANGLSFHTKCTEFLN